MKIKHFMDIDNLRELDTDIRKSNAILFQVGDIIQITEKYDGSNACATYDIDNDCMVAFSRKQELDFGKTLNGFWNYVQKFNQDTINVFKKHSSWRVFGEWSNKNKIIYYDTNKVKHWYIYDIYDMETQKWLSQDIVKQFAQEANLEYINILYEGEFISWEHCRSFLHSPAYGDRQEGVVVKNQSKLNSDDIRCNFYLKIVNDDFKESMQTKEKAVKSETQGITDEIKVLASSIITLNRVQKELYKMRDEQLIPEKLSPQDMGKIAKILPSRIYNDCVKEEREIVEQCGEHFGRLCNSITMNLVRSILL